MKMINIAQQLSHCEVECRDGFQKYELKLRKSICIITNISNGGQFVSSCMNVVNKNRCYFIQYFFFKLKIMKLPIRFETKEDFFI